MRSGEMRSGETWVLSVLLAGCAGESAPEAAPAAAPQAAPEVRFVRDGLLHGGTPAALPPGAQILAPGALFPAGGWLEPRLWTPGEQVGGAVAPLMAECLPLFSVELEDMSRLAAAGAPTPDTAVAFSPDGSRLAIGGFGGSLRVVDGWSGAEIARASIPEGYARQLAWSADGATLYVGEQSPEARLSARDPATLAARWELSLAADLERSPLPPAEDVYGPYSLPGLYTVEVLEDGTLLVTGAHGWTLADGSRRNRSKLWRVGADGRIMDAWPESGAADAVLLHPVVHDRWLLTGISRSATGPDPIGLPIGGVALFELDSMNMRWGHRFEPLKPHFSSVFIWQALGLSDAHALVGLGDGRAFLLNLDGEEVRQIAPGAPQIAAGVPIAAGIGFAALGHAPGAPGAGAPGAGGDIAWLLTTETTIPFGSSDPMARPPAAHPAQNTVHAWGADGAVRWTRQMEHALVGVQPSPDDRELLLAAGSRQTDARTDLFGAVVLDAATGSVRALCPTGGPAFFNPVYGPDGRRIAVASAPFLQEGAVRGRYAVDVFR